MPVYVGYNVYRNVNGEECLHLASASQGCASLLSVQINQKVGKSSTMTENFQLSSETSWISLKRSIKEFTLNYYVATWHPVSFWSVENCVRIASQEALLCPDPVIPSQGQGQWKRYTMVEVNSAYEDERYETNWLKILRVFVLFCFVVVVVFVFCFLAAQDGQSAG